MSTLLNKPVRTFIGYASIVLLASVPVYFFTVDHIWLSELDENNEIIAERAIYQLARTDYKMHNRDSLFAFWNILQPNARLERLDNNVPMPEVRTYTVYMGHVNPDYKWTKDRFRVLERAFIMDGDPFLLVVESNVEETYETAAIIGLITGVFFIILSIGFIVLSRRMSNRIWLPFRETLGKLKGFRVDDREKVEFSRTDILEFNELHDTLDKLIARNIGVFRMQKEFTENASHELQTPLAIIQSKLDLLIQSESINRSQYQLVEDVNKALARAVRINRNLLLLAKVENNQFTDMEDVDLATEIQEVIDLLGDEFQRRTIQLELRADRGVVLHANRFLVTTVIQNMVTNALRYCDAGGKISIIVKNGHFSIANSGHRELNRERLFQRFAVLDNNNPNTGIGLAMVHGICKQNGWEISYVFEQGMHRFMIALAKPIAQ